MPNILIKKATEKDTSLLISLIHGLADYEQAADKVKVTPERIKSNFFSDQPLVHAVIAYHDGQAVGYAIYFYTYSSYLGQPGIYLEDLYVKPNLRGKNIGKKILCNLAKIAQEKDCAQIAWSVLNWNQPAIDFYLKVGAKPTDCIPYKLIGDELQHLVESVS